ncbi:four helix bundle protein [Fibrobacterota bacterium]
MEYWGKNRNKNRGYQKLRVWRDAVDYYVSSSKVYSKFTYHLKRIASQAIVSSDSIHGNIAEGYCRKSIREYLQFLNIALGSLGESVSGNIAYKKAEQITDEDYEKLDALAYKLENGLLKLVESLEHKRNHGDWVDSLTEKERDDVYSYESGMK